MIQDTIKKTGLPCVYSHSEKGITPPYIAYIGSGQEQFKADNTRFSYYNTYQVEFYFKEKNEDLEDTIEQTLLADGFFFEKSEDIFLEDENVFLIYYYVQ